ncbi:MAG: glycosyltransferase [Proteobacteria bacterium]|nr:glycosyltransferase [Pseudomonadota bacterium]
MTLRADVIMPIRNGARFIVPALKSILADQALGTLIIIDDGSTDDWESAATPYLKRGRTMVIKQPASGIAAALNRGLEASTSKYVARMDADDVSLPGRLESQIAWMERFPHIVAVGAQVVEIDTDGVLGKRSNYPTKPDQLRHELLERGRCAVCHPSVMLRRCDVIAAGGYRQSFLHAEDYDLWLRLSENGLVANLTRCFLRRRVHSGQISHLQRVRQSFTRDLALFAARERAGRRPDPTAPWVKPLSYLELQSSLHHPTIQKLATAYEAIDNFYTGRHASLSVGAVRAIPLLARQSYLGETRRIRYNLIRTAGNAALRRGNIGDALEAYMALARCRTADSKYFRKKTPVGAR